MRQPNLCIRIRYFSRCIFIPIIWFFGIRIRNLLSLIPILWLFVVWIINLLRGVDWWSEIFQQTSRANTSLVHKHFKGVVWSYYQGEEMSLLAIKNTLKIPSWFLCVFLLVFTSLWILMPKNEVKLKENLLNFLLGKIHYCMKGLNHQK